MAEENPISTRSGNGKNLTERLRDIGPRPVMAMDPQGPELPAGEIVRDWLEGAHASFRQREFDLTKAWASKMLAIEDERHQFMRRALEALTK